jgi:prolyl oligopeptidase
VASTDFGKHLRAGLAFGALVILTTSAEARDATAPVTPTGNAADTYQGVTVPDPYRWLENTDDPKVHAWSVAQDGRTRSYLDGLPYRAATYDRLMKQISATSSSYFGLHVVGDKIFAFYNEPPKQQPMIALLTNAADPATARVIVDPNAINSAGTTAIDWFVPSPDGSKLAVSLSDNGSEDGTVHIFDVATGKETGETVPRVQYPTGGGSLAWREDGGGFWYTRYPGSERPAEEQHFFQQIYFHALGSDPAGDAYVLGKDFPKVAEIHLDNSQNPHVVLATVANGDGGEYAHFILRPDGGATQVTRFADQIVAAAVGPDDMLYLVSRKDAPRGKLLKLPLGDLDLAHAKLIVPEGEPVIQTGDEFGGEPIIATGKALYVREIVGGPSQVAIFDPDGKARGTLPLPGVATVSEVAPLSDGSLVYSVATYLEPPYFTRFDPASGNSEKTKLAETSPVKFEDTEVLRAFATSKDGTKVPLNIVAKKGTKLDGTNPVLLNGYGGYGVVEAPYFLGAEQRLWLDAGGIFVAVNLRGGGEFGETWHAEGALTHKQNVFDDFTAAAQYLIQQHYTSPDHLAIIGGSNGGLLMGAVTIQHPELFRAVVSLVGIYDMLRVELDPNGSFNTTEFGTVKDLAQFKALFAYSPYHHVKKGAKYPAIFMATGEHDGRVNPMHSRKMIARLQAATGSNHPIYLSINTKAGHGIGSALSIKVGQTADFMSFLFDQLGMKPPVS